MLISVGVFFRKTDRMTCGAARHQQCCKQRYACHHTEHCEAHPVVGARPHGRVGLIQCLRSWCLGAFFLWHRSCWLRSLRVAELEVHYLDRAKLGFTPVRRATEAPSAENASEQILCEVEVYRLQYPNNKGVECYTV